MGQDLCAFAGPGQSLVQPELVRAWDGRVDPVLTVSLVLQELLDSPWPGSGAKGQSGGDLVTPISSITSPSPPHIKPTQTGRLSVLKPYCWGFLGGSVVENPSASVGDTGSTPEPGRSHILQSN